MQCNYVLGFVLKEKDFLILKADNINYDANSAIFIANNNIYISIRPYTLRANNLYYNLKKDLLIAKGDIKIKDEITATTISAWRIIFKEGFKNIFIDEALIKLADNSLITALYGTKNDINKLSLYEATFTPCKIYCDNKPIWQIKAKNTCIDYDQKKIIYTNMVLEFLGFPLLYFPYFFHPILKSSVKSGFFLPKIIRNKLVFPFYFTVKPNLDLALIPHISKKYVLFEVQVQNIFKNGIYELKTNYTNNYSNSRKEE